ncbi:MAG: HAD family hydrolase [Candidatus Omnitrophica bacterium]|nr:HAD family hydrolase [Candidatus Omnitrophota bacterium]
MVDVKINGETIKGIELFVFDKDGTLMDLYLYWRSMIALRAERLCLFYGLDIDEHKENLMDAMGIDVPGERLKPEGPVGLLPRAIVQKAAEDYLINCGCEDVSSVCFRVFEEVDDASVSLLDKFIQPLEGAVDLVRKIKENGCKVAIATTDRTERAKLAMKFLDMDEFVDIVIGADKVQNSKPSPEMLTSIGSALGTAPGESIMVGDAKTDVQMGINADFKASVGVCSGLASREVLSSLTPYVIEDVSEIHLEPVPKG